MIYANLGKYKYFSVHSPIRASPPPCKEGLCPHITEKQSETWRWCSESSSCLHFQYVGFSTYCKTFSLHTPWASSYLQSLQMPSCLTGQHFLSPGRDKLVTCDFFVKHFIMTPHHCTHPPKQGKPSTNNMVLSWEEGWKSRGRRERFALDLRLQF